MDLTGDFQILALSTSFVPQKYKHHLQDTYHIRHEIYNQPCPHFQAHVLSHKREASPRLLVSMSP